MAGEKTQSNNRSFALPLVIGGLIGGGIAVAAAPQLARTKLAVIAGFQKVMQMVVKKKKEQKSEEGIYCDVPEGADICYDEEKR